MDADSDRLVGNVGLVSPRKIQFDAPLELECGRVMPAYDIVYETYGELNAARDNAILVCHALSGDHHAAGYNAETDRKPGWWDHYIGPGKPIDTKLFHVVSLNNLGGCGGSTGPNSINPETGKPWGADFPVVTVKDWVKVQARLADSLGIDAWVSIAGGSLGAMQGLQWAIDFPDRVRSALIIAAAPRLSAQNIAFNEIARKAIQSDPNFLAGDYEGRGVVPRHGLMLARMLGHVTYLSDDLMRSKFGRDLRKGKIGFDFDAEFQVESYLRHQGEAFVDRFDANTYLLMTKALDYFDPAMEYGDNLTEAVRRTRARFLAVAFSSDWRFSPERSREIVKALHDAGRPVSYVEIDSADGHDAFLLPNADYAATLRAFLRRVHNDFCGRAGR